MPAAGLFELEVLVRVDALSTAGRHRHFAGTFTLRRVNDVPGSTAAQRRWHIVTANLRPVPS